MTKAKFAVTAATIDVLYAVQPAPSAIDTVNHIKALALGQHLLVEAQYDAMNGKFSIRELNNKDLSYFLQTLYTSFQF